MEPAAALIVIDCNVVVAVKFATEPDDLLRNTFWLAGWKLNPDFAGVTV